MRKRTLVLLSSAVVIVLMNISSGMAAVFQAFSPLTFDQVAVLDKNSLDGINHGLIFHNAVDGSEFAVVLDPNGAPTTAFAGFAYFWADLLTIPPTLYGSIDGTNWTCLNCP